MSEEVQLAKSGETLVAAVLSRYKALLKLSIKVHPSVEDLFRVWGSNDVSPAQKWGRQWEGKGDLLCYNLAQNPGVLPIDTIGGYFCLDRVGGALLENRTFQGPMPGQNVQAEVLNMSFLRLVGISEGTGVEFAVKGVHTPQKVKEIAEKIKMAARSIYVIYMKPIDIEVGVYTRPWMERGVLNDVAR
jgi:hypothetical protein